MSSQGYSSDVISSNIPITRGSKRTMADSRPPAKKIKTIATNETHLDSSHLSPGWVEASSSQEAKLQSLQLTYHKGDMFADVPQGTVLVHACNTQGHWGAGIAKAFKQLYPKAYADYHTFCTKNHNKSSPVLTGTAQLLAPRDGDKQHWIGCVFTSAKYGKGKDKPDMIVRNTAKSMPMLLELISQVDDQITGIRMCRINSGKFGVSWEKTEEVLKDIELKPHWRTKIEVWEPEDE
ncbi:ADP-ribose 1''-phosphate phosphatase [Didymella sp. IMI 355093]|nr:ADP-ribose 1''-phosphate phosphatase [Didymella sp. IMI 355093]